MRKLIASAAAACLLASCTEKKEAAAPPKPVAVAPPVAVVAPPATVKIEEISITSSSAPAIEAFKRGRAHSEQGRITEAGAEFEQAVKLDGRFSLALAYLGFFNPTEEGSGMLNRAVTLADTLPAPEKLLVEHLRSWRQGDGPTLHAQRKQLVELAPTDWRVRLLIGMGAQEDRQWAESAVALREAIRINPDAAPAYNLLGYALMNQGKFDEAIAVLTTSTQKAPTEANAFDSLGEAQLRAGQNEAAEASFAKAAALAPKAWASQVGVAQTRFLRGDWKGGREALAAASAAAEQPADKVEASTCLVWSYLAEGLTEDAIKAADALEKEAKARHQGLPYATAPILRAIALTQAGQLDKALLQIPTAMDRVRKAGVQGDALARLYRSALLWKLIAEVRQKKIKEAETTFAVLQKAVSMSLNAESLSTRSHASGLLSLAHGEKQIALQQLLECNEDDFLCHLDLAAVQELLGDSAAAEATRKRLVSANRREASYLYARAVAKGLAAKGAHQ